MHSYHSYVFLGLASTLMSTNRFTWPNKRQIWTCTQSKLQSRTKPGYLRSLSYDPVSVWPRIRQSESCFVLKLNVCLLLSQHQNPFFSSLHAVFQVPKNRRGIFARRAMVDQARQGLCYQRET